VQAYGVPERRYGFFFFFRRRQLRVMSSREECEPRCALSSTAYVWRWADARIFPLFFDEALAMQRSEARRLVDRSAVCSGGGGVG